jgi:hypothetical protein
MRIRYLILPALAILLLALPAWAALSDVPVVWDIQIAHQGGEVSLVILPDGSGPDLTQAMTYQGGPVDAAITVQLISAETCAYWILQFPFEDIWLDPAGENWRAADGSPIQGTFWADRNTDLNGLTEFRRGLRGGGWSTGPLTLYLTGSPAADYCRDGAPFPPIAMRFNSPDINADLQVNLIDVVLFTQDFYGDYAYRSDFVWDGVIDLLDLAVLAESFGISTPDLE